MRHFTLSSQNLAPTQFRQLQHRFVKTLDKYYISFFTYEDTDSYSIHCFSFSYISDQKNATNTSQLYAMKSGSCRKFREREENGGVVGALPAEDTVLIKAKEVKLS